MPAEADFESQEIADLLQKYLQGKRDVSIFDRTSAAWTDVQSHFFSTHNSHINRTYLQLPDNLLKQK
jgi:aromatic ring hydroxylase